MVNGNRSIINSVTTITLGNYAINRIISSTIAHGGIIQIQSTVRDVDRIPIAFCRQAAQRRQAVRTRVLHAVTARHSYGCYDWAWRLRSYQQYSEPYVASEKLHCDRKRDIGGDIGVNCGDVESRVITFFNDGELKDTERCLAYLRA